MITHGAAAAIALLAFATTARGSIPVPITNAGFENPAKGEGAWQATAPGWSQGQYDVTAPTVWIVGVPINYVGLYNPGTGDYTSAAAPEGLNVGFSTSQLGFDVGLNQVLAATLQADAQYDLSVKVGNPFVYNKVATADWRIELLAGGVVIASATGPSPATDASITTASLTYNSGAAPAQLGQQLEIRLLAVNFATDHQVDFDDVQLTATYTNPVAAPGGPYAVLSIASLSLNGSASLPSDGSSIDPAGYEWDLNNDGTFGDVTGATPTAIPYTTLTSTYGMAPGDNTIKLRVTDAAAKSSITATTVTLTVASTNADLDSLTTNPATTLAPTFPTSGEFNYTTTVPYATTSITVTPTKAQAGATIGFSLDDITYAPIASGNPSPSITLADAGIPKAIYLKVTAEDTTTIQTYTLTVTRAAASTNANLADLTTTPATTFDSTFSPSTLAYATTLPYPITSMKVTPTAADTLATIKVNGNTVASGSESAPIPLSAGVNVINTVVTAEDPSVLPQTYKLTVTVTVADPYALPGGPYSVSFGGSLVLNGSASLPADGQTIANPAGYEWDLNINDNGGVFNADFTGPTPPSITYPDLQSLHGMTVGPNTIKLRVTDSSPKTSTVEGTVIINPPVSIFTSGTVQPAFNGADQGYFNSPLPSADGSPGDKWFAEVSGAGQTKGQTFTVTGDRLLKGITYRLGSTMAQPTKVYVVRVGAVDTATNAFYPLFSEEITQTVSWGATGVTDSYGTWTFATQRKLPGLPAGTVYGFDIAMKSSTSAWQTGIPYITYKNTNVFAGGFKYTCAQTGTQGSATNTVQPDSARDREFHLDMDAITIADTTAPTLVSVSDSVSGGPIYADQVQVIYTLTFNEAINASTIDLADFENLGSGVSIDSVVSVQNTTPYPAASVVKVVLGISGTGTLKLGIKSGSNIADVAGNPVTSPAADDTEITVNPGTNPSTGSRWWDLATTGITDGASQGGTGTWNTTTTNWDRGFGFAAPVQWNNSNNDNAIFGGTAGTVTLDGDMSLAGLSVSLPTGTGSGYSIGNVGEGNKLTFTGAKLVTTTATGTGTNQDVTIRTGIAGSPTMNIAGRATNSVDNFSLVPGSDVTQTIGTLNMLNTFASNKRLILGGTSTGNAVDTVTWSVTNNQLMLTKAGTGSWTINNNLAFSTGGSRASKLYVEQGTLTLGGTSNFLTHKVGVSTVRESNFTASGTASKLIAKGTITIGDNREFFYVQNLGTISPGPGVATLAVTWNANSSTATANGAFNMQTGSTYEWDIASNTSTDVINVTTGGSNNGNLILGNMTIKVKDAGVTTPIVSTDQLPVFTYETGAQAVVRSIGTVTIDVSALGAGWGGTPSLVDNGTGTIYISGLSKSVAGFASWKTTNGATGQTLGQDHDGDGVSNGVEYFLVGPTGTSTGFTTLPGVINTAGILSVTWPKGGGYTGVYPTDFVVETSADLSIWAPATGGTVVDQAGYVKYTFPTPLGTAKFARLKVTGP